MIAVPETEVPRGRGRNPLLDPVVDIAQRLEASPGVWFVIGTGAHSERSRLNNAAAMLRGGRYRSLEDWYARGRFETRVSGARNAPHADEHDVVVYGRWIAR